MTVRIEKLGRRITVTSNLPLQGLKTAVPGAYETASGYWTVPLSIESCRLLRMKFGPSLVIGNSLNRWAREVLRNRKGMAKLATAHDAPLRVLPAAAPKLYDAMRKRKYQRVGVRFIADNPATLLADDPGLGKTLIAMGGVLESKIPGPYLVVAPKTAADTVWRREISRWLPDTHRAVTLPELRYQREHKLALTRYGPTTWLIVHPEITMVQCWLVCRALVKRRKRVRSKRTGKVRLRVITEECGKRTAESNRQRRELSCGHIKDRRTKRLFDYSYQKLFEIEWGAIIIDESHESLIRRTGAQTQRRRGLDMLKLRGDGIKIAMSGTPFDSKPHQLWGTLNWLAPEQYSAFHRWAELYWRKGGYTGFQIGEFIKEREQLLWDSLSAIALRRTKLEVAPDLPPKLYVGTPLEPSNPDSPIGIWLPMEGEQARAYEQMEIASATELESGRLEAITALAELTRLKQLACSYGDIEEYWVKVRENKCAELNFGESCRECTHFGYHREKRYRYTPRLPSNKFNWVVENLEEWGYPGNPITKVVIVSFYSGILHEFGKGIEQHFRTKPSAPLCAAITGRTRMGDRRKIIDRFNSDGGPHVMLLNVKAGGTAITLDTADRTIFISETRIPDQQLQAEDRTHRVSNPRKCMYYYLRSLGTVDVGTALVNEEMKMDSHRLLDGRRGVEYMRHVLDLSKH